jgi:hypothetical protein
MEVFAIANVNNTYSKIIGAVVALVGILGFFMTSPLFGLFGVNMYSNIVHLLGGALVFWKAGKSTNMIFGFVPYLNVVTTWLGFNTAFHWLHIAIGVVSLAIYKFSD